MRLAYWLKYKAKTARVAHADWMLLRHAGYAGGTYQAVTAPVSYELAVTASLICGIQQLLTCGIYIGDASFHLGCHTSYCVCVTPIYNTYSVPLRFTSIMSL